MDSKMIILGLETSCDETAASVIEANDAFLSVKSNIVSSQVQLHAPWGGVVPNLAAREHLKNILPVTEKCLKEANIKPQDIDAIAVTNGPGLIPALLMGVNAAKTLSYVWGKPLLGIHHIEGHIYANFIDRKERNAERITLSVPRSTFHAPQFPLLCLVVSGGHTQLVYMKKHLDYKIIGETLDDAAGEAFDKVARILGLEYPGGPVISRLAKSFSGSSPYEISLPRPMLNSRDFNFSFSGLKTSVLYTTRKNEKFLQDPLFISAMCREFQQSVIDVLVSKTIKAAQKYGPKTISLAGGVSANTELREQLGKAIKQQLPNTKYQIPDTKYSADNAAMIAAAGYFRYNSQKDKKIFYSNWKNLEANANLKLE